MLSLAFMRFMSNNMLTHVDLTEQVLDAKGLECDEIISKLSEDKLREILEEVRRLRNSKRRKRIDDETEEDEGSTKKEVLYVS